MALTKIRFPETEQLGDVTKIDGTKVVPVDIVCAGSPCQNLSVAGNREGLAGEQSGLFRESIRIIRQLRKSTGGGRFFVWENVPGAFTSGSERGADFRAVLESIAETSIPMPKDGRWANAGMVQCPKCEIAWRVFDAQYWGVPQRRKRIFLVADFAATDRRAAKVLFVSKGVSGDSEQGRETRKRTASTIEKSIRTASEIVHKGGTAVVKIRSGRDDGSAGKGALIGLEQSFTLGTGNDQTLFQEQQFCDCYNGIISGEKSVTLTAASAASANHSGPAVLEQKGYDATIYPINTQNITRNTDDKRRGFGIGENGDPMFALEAGHSHGVIMDMTHANDVIRESKGLSPTLNARMGTGGNQVPILMESIPSFKAFDEYNFSVDSKVKTLEARDFKGGAIVFRQDAKQPMESIPKNIIFEPGVASRDGGHIYTDGKSPTLRAVPGDNFPTVAQPMSTTGGQSAYAIGNGQTNQPMMTDKAGTLNCMHDQIAIMQKLATEDKSQEACALTMDEDSTDKT